MKSFEIFWKNYQIGMYAEIEEGSGNQKTTRTRIPHATLYYVLKNTITLIAPVLPFLSQKPFTKI